MTNAPEYYEHVRLRDVYMRDVAALATMRETLQAQQRLLNSVSHREDTAKASQSLSHTIVALERLRRGLQRECDDHTVAINDAA